MASAFADELDTVAARLRAMAAAGSAEDVAEPLRGLREAALAVGEAWSGSSLGYQARVYYAKFAPRPADAHWSSEWGMFPPASNRSSGSTGYWKLCTRARVIDEIRRRAGDPDMRMADELAAQACHAVDAAQADLQSILAAFQGDGPDEFLRGLKDRLGAVSVPTAEQLAQATLANQGCKSRDVQAMDEGPQVAPHRWVLAEVEAVLAALRACEQLADFATQGSAHIRRLEAVRRTRAAPRGAAVFIGHGRSAQWRELKDFVDDELGLPWEEFNRRPAAGLANAARLTQLLETSAIAFLVLTAEDELADGSFVARQNVVHEAGLFQGRLGFPRAIVLLENGCKAFSNIEGLGQIRFPRGRIAAAFEGVRQVLRREGFLTAEEAAPSQRILAVPPARAAPEC